MKLIEKAHVESTIINFISWKWQNMLWPLHKKHRDLQDTPYEPPTIQQYLPEENM